MTSCCQGCAGGPHCPARGACLPGLGRRAAAPDWLDGNVPWEAWAALMAQEGRALCTVNLGGLVCDTHPRHTWRRCIWTLNTSSRKHGEGAELGIHPGSSPAPGSPRTPPLSLQTSALKILRITQVLNQVLRVVKGPPAAEEEPPVVP